MKKLVFVMLFLLCFMTVPAFALGGTAAGNSISPHEEGVCAPNTAVVLVDKPEDTEPVEAVEDAEEQEPEEDESAETPEEMGEEEEMTIDEMVQANRDPDSEVWYNIEDDDCPGHEWFDGVCLNCGAEDSQETEDTAEDESEPNEEDESEIDDTEEEPAEETETEVE